MYIIEFISLMLLIYLCFLSTKSDLSSGLIHNKTLLLFVSFAIVLDSFYYGYFASDLFADFLLNIGVVVVVSLYLFYSHLFAGGDCKLIIVLAILYPARFYFVYGRSNTTLIFAVVFAILAGYLYLLVNSIWAIVTKKVKITSRYVKRYILTFLKSYLTATLYISLINLMFILLRRYGLEINIWITRLLFMTLAWCVVKFPILKNSLWIITVSTVVILFSGILKTIPFSMNPENYTLVLVILCCQMTIKTSVYEIIAIDRIKNGMILSTMSTLLMQSSMTKGLPSVSSEDLKSRLTDSEINSVRIWAKATRTESLTIVKKIPFAIFISIGYISYYILWRILWV